MQRARRCCRSFAPPPTIALWSVVARLSYPIAAGLWSALLVIAALALVTVVVCASATPRAQALLYASVLAVGFGPLTSDLALGQVALLAFLAAALASLPLSLLPTIAASAVAFAQPNVAFGLIAPLGRNRATAGIALGALAAYALGAAFFGCGGRFEYATQLADTHPRRAVRRDSVHSGRNRPRRRILARSWPAAIAVACAAAALLAAVVLWRRIARSVCALRRDRGAGTLRHDVLSRTRSRRRLRRGRLVRVSDARPAALPRAGGDAARSDRLARPRAAPDRHRSKRLTRRRRRVRIRCARRRGRRVSASRITLARLPRRLSLPSYSSSRRGSSRRIRHPSGPTHSARSTHPRQRRSPAFGPPNSNAPDSSQSNRCGPSCARFHSWAAHCWH